MGVAAAGGPALILLVGAPGTGKSTIARFLARALGAELVQTDRVRKQLFAEPRYTGGEHAAVYGWCHQLIRSCLKVNKIVVFDATNLEERGRRRVYEIADACNARLIILWAMCSERIVSQRMLRRQADEDDLDLSDADWDVYLQMRRKQDAIRRPHLLLNTGVDCSTVLDRVVGQLADSLQRSGERKGGGPSSPDG